MLRHLVTFLGVLSIVVFSAAVASAAFIPVIDIGVPAGFTTSMAFDFNANGDVAVQSGATVNAFLWNDGTFTPLGNLGYNYAYPRGVDEDGTIVGMSKKVSGTYGRAYKWTSGGGMVDLGSWGGASGYSRCDFINDGDIVGSSTIAGSTSTWHAFVMYSGTTTMTDIHIPGAGVGTNSYAYKINDNGKIVGMCSTPQRGFFYDGATMESIGVLAADHTLSIAYGINNSDVVVGYSGKTGDQQAISWTKAGGMVGLGLLDDTQLYSIAVEINNLGQIVGKARINVGTVEAPVVEDHAVIWNGGVITDLNSLIDPASGWILQQGTMIDDNGKIAGVGLKDGIQHGFVLTIPEPSTLALLAAGLVGLMAYAWRKRK